MPPAVPFSIVDAFSSEPFAGNPAAVCLLAREADPGWMQSVAAELALPATAFVTAGLGLRWFTPVAELDVCGHGTLAAAHVLWEARGRSGPLEFTTRMGAIAVVREGESILITLPAGAAVEAEPPAGLIDSMRGVPVTSVWRTPLDYLLVLAAAEDVTALVPDLDRVRAIDTRGVIVTAEGGNGEVDFTSRFFAPALGLPEDQATGSMHASLGPFWAARLGKTALRARQASRRGALLDVRVEGDSVRIGGPAVTVARGELATGPTV
jgi:PhzF family phenazine biosynthesis protein